MNISNNFATLDYDAHINTKIDFTINHVFKSMTVQELNTLHTICELERTQLLTILAMSVKNPQLAGFLLTGNRSNFLYVEGSTAWLYDCPHFISPLYKADKCFDRIPIHYRETIMYVDPITRQTFNYATPIECGNNPQNIIELDPDSNDGDFFVSTPEPLKREAPQMFKPTQIETTITPNTFTAQDAGIYSNAELDQFWNRVLFAKHSDTTLQLLGKSLGYDFISMRNDKHSYSGHNPYNHLRIYGWLYDCPHFISPLYKADKCFDRIPIHYRETIMYVDPITRQTFNYATPIECGNNPQNIIELDPDSNDGDFYVLTPEPLKREAPQMFKPTQIKTTITPNTFTAQDAGIYSNAELDQFWNRV